MPLRFRVATPADAPEMLAIYAPFCRTHTSFEAEPPSVEELARRISRGLERYPSLVCEVDGAVAGYCYATQHRERAAYQWSAETTVYVHEAYRGRGIGKALCTSLLQLLRLQGFVNALAVIALPNPASVALHESLGFESVGAFAQAGHKAGAWHDVLWMQLRLLHSPPHPTAPRTPEELQGSAEWRQALESGAHILAPEP